MAIWLNRSLERQLFQIEIFRRSASQARDLRRGVTLRAYFMARLKSHNDRVICPFAANSSRTLCHEFAWRSSLSRKQAAHRGLVITLNGASYKFYCGSDKQQECAAAATRHFVQGAVSDLRPFRVRLFECQLTFSPFATERTHRREDAAPEGAGNCVLSGCRIV